LSVSVFARVLKRIAVPNKIDYVFFKHGRAFPDWRLCYGPVESGNSPGPPTFTETSRFGKRQVESWSRCPPHFVQGILNGNPIGFPPEAYRCIADALNAGNGAQCPQAKGAFGEKPGPFVGGFVRH
jgi:hypothetical protein